MTKLKRWLILFNVAVSIFMATLDGSIVNIALPIISNELKVTISSIQWVVTSYLITISILLLAWGKLADIYGKKKIFSFGFIIFTIGSTLCGLSKSLELLVFSRILQAVGASATMALGQGIVTSIFPPRDRGKALGITGTTVAIGSLVGPSLGGILVHAAGWESIFFINIPIGVIGSILTFFIMPEMKNQDAEKAFDIKGTMLFSASILFLFLSLLFLQEGKISFVIFILMVVVSVVCMIMFIRLERVIDYPLINLNIFKTHEFSIGLLSAFLSFVAISTTLLFMPFYLQYALKLDTLTAGILISFYPITSAIVSPVSGWLSDKITYKPLTIMGLGLNTIVLFVLSRLNNMSSYTYIAFLMIMLGAGVSIFQSPNNSSVMGAVKNGQLGIAGGINALFRNLGMVSGTTLSVLIFSFVTKMNINSLNNSGTYQDVGLFIKGYSTVLVFASFSCLLAAVISLTRAIKY